MLAAEHTVKAFDFDLQELARMIAEMGGLVEKQLAEAVDALARRDRERGSRVISGDAVIDAHQRAIETKAVATIATRQPNAVDLRAIVGVLRIANDIERVGDLAKNIAKRVIELDDATMPRRSLRGVNHMTTLALEQFRDVLDSLAERDSGKAIRVRSRDVEIDRIYMSLFRELVGQMMEDPGTIALGLHLLFCAKNLERIGDHAANIGETVYCMVEGRTFAVPIAPESPAGESNEAPPPVCQPMG